MIKERISEIQAELALLETALEVDSNAHLSKKMYLLHGEMYGYLQEYERIMARMDQMLREARDLRRYGEVQKH